MKLTQTELETRIRTIDELEEILTDIVNDLHWGHDAMHEYVGTSHTLATVQSMLVKQANRISKIRFPLAIAYKVTHETTRE